MNSAALATIAPQTYPIVSERDSRDRLDFWQQRLVTQPPLIDRVAAGDQDAFASLYDDLGRLVFGIVLRVLRDPAMSEEVTQEVFLEIWQSAPKFDPRRGSVKSWAATIAHRRAVDRVRSVEASRKRDETAANEEDLVTDGADEPMLQNASEQLVRSAVDQLPEAQREAIQLAYFGGKTYRQVAADLGVPEGTIKTRIRDGMQRLRTLLKHSGMEVG